jgi:hypothetical protein
MPSGPSVNGIKSRPMLEMIFSGHRAHPGTAPAVDDIANSVERLFVCRKVEETGHGDEVTGVECFTDPIAIASLRGLLKSVDCYAGEHPGPVYVENLGFSFGVHLFSLHVAVLHPDAVRPSSERHQVAAHDFRI